MPSPPSTELPIVLPNGVPSDSPFGRFQMAFLAALLALLLLLWGDLAWAAGAAALATALFALAVPWLLRQNLERGLFADMQVVREGPIVRVDFRPIRGAELSGISLVVLQTRFTADANDGSGEAFSLSHEELQTHPLSGPISLRSGESYSFQAQLSALPPMEEVRKDDQGAPGDHPRLATGLQVEVRVLIARRPAPLKMAFWLMELDSRR